jgi:RNA polymerase sigma-70 factor (ECF subfamily)
MTTTEDFGRRIDPHRRELLAHCYRMLGSMHDAEDLVQETMLRAWRARDQYDERRASLRTWLYRIATNACLTALQGKQRRPLPSGLGGPSDDPTEPLALGREVSWLQPFPDALLGARNDPAARLVARGSMRLALIAALQFLPARQRAVVILREVLDYSAAETAAILHTTPTAVNSSLQRARARLGAVAPLEEELDEPADAARRELLDRYVAAFENADVDALTTLLTDDAILEMPPMTNWYAGRENYGRFIARVFELRGTDWRMIAAAANGQPAVTAYVRGEDGAYHLHTLQLFSITASGISGCTVFQDADVFEIFGLATVLPATVIPRGHPVGRSLS